LLKRICYVSFLTSNLECIYYKRSRLTVEWTIHSEKCAAFAAVRGDRKPFVRFAHEPVSLAVLFKLFQSGKMFEDVNNNE
jgi:hypothetical protein